MSIKKYKESVASSEAKMKKAGKNLEKRLACFLLLRYNAAAKQTLCNTAMIKKNQVFTGSLFYLPLNAGLYA